MVCFILHLLNLLIIVSRIEKDKSQIMNETADVRSATEEVNRSKVISFNPNEHYKYNLYEKI